MLQSISDKTMDAYINNMYASLDGKITIAQKNKHFWAEKNIAVSSLSRNDLYDKEDVYISANSYFGSNRAKANIKRYNMICIDIDCYKLGMSQYKAYELLTSMIYEDHLLPEPSYIINSGNGLYYQLLLTQADANGKKGEHANAAPRYQLMASWLCEKLAHLGADPTSKDAAHVFRPVGSINTKNKAERVDIWEANDKTYTLDALIANYLPASYKKHKQCNILGIPKPKKTKKNQNHKKAKIAFLSTPYTIALHRLSDLNTLYQYRTQNGDAAKGTREFACFVYRYYSLFVSSGDQNQALLDTLAFNGRLLKPLAETEVKRATRSANKAYKAFLTDKQKGYNYTNKSLIDLLGVNNTELEQLEFIRVTKNKAQKKQSDRNRYLKSLKKLKKSTKKQNIFERRCKIVYYLHQNMTINDICGTLHINKRTYYRDVKDINNSGKMYHVLMHKPGNMGVFINSDKKSTPKLLDSVLAEKVVGVYEDTG